MAINYFIGESREQLEKFLKAARADLATGKVLTQWGAGDSQGQSRVMLTPQVRYQMIYFALWSLEEKEGVAESDKDFPLAAMQRTERTKATFS